MTTSPERAAEFIALARANLAQAKAQLCSHGISPRICQEHETESVSEEP